MIIFKKQVFNQAIRGVKEKTEILAISNRYKNILEDFVNSLDIKLSNMPKLINKEPYNIILGFENSLTKLKLDKNFLDESQRQL